MGNQRQDLGDWGEVTAAAYLAGKGYRVLHRRFRIGRQGEIDLICSKGNATVFVEVKAGSTSRYGSPEERITRRKLARLHRLGMHYIDCSGEGKREYRIDVVVVDGSPERYQIRHYPNVYRL